MLQVDGMPGPDGCCELLDHCISFQCVVITDVGPDCELPRSVRVLLKIVGLLCGSEKMTGPSAHLVWTLRWIMERRQHS